MRADRNFYETPENRFAKTTSLVVMGFTFVSAAYAYLTVDVYTGNLLLGVAAFICFASYIAFSSGYEFSNERLSLKQGFATAWRVDLADIVRAVHVPRSRRFPQGEKVVVEARGKTRWVMVSNAGVFLDELAERAPQLHFYGAELRMAPVLPTAPPKS